MDMAISNLSDTETPFLEEAATAAAEVVVDGCVDYRGLPVSRSSSGGWRSARYIISVEVAERFVYYGIESNLITYLTGPLGQSTVVAAENVNVWSGTAMMLPLVGAFVADSFLGRYRTIIGASIIYVLGLGLLTLSALIPPLSSSSDCENTNNKTSCSSNYMVQVVVFYFSLYLVAIGQGGHKPCAQAFGADQFDGQYPEECRARSSFFNWWYFGSCAGAIFTVTVLSYIQDNLSWGLGFGIPCIFMVAALVVFLLGTKTYRYSSKRDDRSALVRIGRVFVAAVRNWRTPPPAVALEEETRGGTLPHQSVEQFKFLSRALLAPEGSKESEDMCSISEVEEAKACLSLVPIWVTSLMYAIVFSQPPTFFTKQGATMDRSVTPGLNVPAASLQSLIGITTVLTIPIYDRVFVPITRAFTQKPAGITVLQRIGIGMFLSALSMVSAALVETRRLKTAVEYGLVDKPNMTIPMSIRWLIPQYALFGVADVFTMVGLQEFFYNQVPIELKSVGLSLYLSIFGVGSFLSGFLVSTVDKATRGDGRDSWFANNLNHGHLDYFYWLLAGLSAIELVAYLYFTKSYIYNK
ncbi:hypothetical protein ACOSQ4_009428 [Xanthoceras sorbifolium]